jgi:hypothetical protein
MSPAIPNLIMVAGLWLVLTLLCCGGGRHSSTDMHRVTYRVDGEGRASLTYRNATGGTEQHEVSLPWEIKFDGRNGEHLYLSAQNKGDFSGLTASISINGRIVKDATSTARYGIATVSTRCCRE